MTCSRCHGILMHDCDEQWSFWRCVTCGERFDTVVQMHRWMQQEVGPCLDQYFPPD